MANTNFINTGLNEKEIRQHQKQLFDVDNIAKPIGIKMPITKGFKSNESLFEMNTDIISQVSNNYKTFLLTKKGELLCKPDFGLTINNIYNRTDLSQEDMENIVMQEISQSTKKYFPFIKLKDFESRIVNSSDLSVPSYVKVSIGYVIEGFEDKTNIIELSIRRSI
jgi:hypothetical protein